MRIFDGGLGRKPKRRTGAVLQEIEAYWEALREDRDMPLRMDVDPRGIETALRHSFILERMAPGMARIRVAGGVFSEVMGMETRGMPMSALFGPSARDGFRDVLEGVFSGPARARLRLEGERGFGRPAISGEMILLPLRSSRGDVTRVLGGLEIDGQMGATPRRFTLTSSFQKSLRGEDVQIDTHGPRRARAQPSGPPASLPRTVATGVPHLRLVVTDA
ncbi:PAS domain-containing protein [Shimia sediminis]|uniref:PAS domain-containing protein n=1 Tax=Shimia sediminis TaxID=2497945 RepID=UPI0013E05939|nr:PAS domain-containing protein [Shimia sediminis]